MRQGVKRKHGPRQSLGGHCARDEARDDSVVFATFLRDEASQMRPPGGTVGRGPVSQGTRPNGEGCRLGIFDGLCSLGHRSTRRSCWRDFSPLTSGD